MLVYRLVGLNNALVRPRRRAANIRPLDVALARGEREARLAATDEGRRVHFTSPSNPPHLSGDGFRQFPPESCLGVPR